MEYDLIDSYKTLEDEYDNKYPTLTEYHSDKWSICPKCESKPRVWEFDNGRSAACKCAKKYGKDNYVHAISIMEYYRKNNGSTIGYPYLELRDNWNKRCYDMDIINRRNSTIDDLL